MASTIDIREIEKHNVSIYEAVIMSAKRARQIHSKTVDELRKKIGEVENEEDLNEETVDRGKIVKEFDKRDKPSVLAMKEFIEGKLHYSTDDED